MDNFTMPDSAFKADRRETEESLAKLNKRVSDLESDVKKLAELVIQLIHTQNSGGNA